MTRRQTRTTKCNNQRESASESAQISVLAVGEMRVGEHFLRSEARPARASGAQGRENVGMSNRKSGEKPDPRKSKVSSATKIDGG